MAWALALGLLGLDVVPAQLLSPRGIWWAGEGQLPAALISVDTPSPLDTVSLALFIYDSLGTQVFCDTLTCVGPDTVDTATGSLVFSWPDRASFRALLVNITPDPNPHNDTLWAWVAVSPPLDTVRESFEGSFPPPGWHLAGPYPWERGPLYGDDLYDPSVAPDGAHYAEFPSWEVPEGGWAEMVSPPVVVGAGYSLGVYYWNGPNWNDPGGANADWVDVYLSRDMGQNWLFLGTLFGDAGAWEPREMGLYSFVGDTVLVKFRAYSDFEVTNLCLDLVSVPSGVGVKEERARPAPRITREGVWFPEAFQVWDPAGRLRAGGPAGLWRPSGPGVYLWEVGSWRGALVWP